MFVVYMIILFRCMHIDKKNRMENLNIWCSQENLFTCGVDNVLIIVYGSILALLINFYPMLFTIE